MRIGLLCLGVAFAFAACTDPAERTHLLVIVDADQSLRASIRYIDVEVRRVSQAAKVSDVVQSNRLMPGGVSGWPLDLRVSNPKAGSDYEVTATAKAADDSTLGVVRAVRPYVAGRTLEVRLHFDEACLARATPCASTYTCRAGMCIDAWGTTTTEPIEPPSEPQAERDAEPPPPAAEPATAAKPEPCDSAGSAAAGCSPTLLALELSAGELKPEFTPEHTTYTAELPLVAGEVVLQLRAAQSVELLANGAPVAEDGRLPVKLGIGDNHLLLTLNAGGSPARSYRLNLRRTGAQRARLTATHGSPGDAFGAGLAVSGDRLVVGAPSEDGSTTTTPPDEAALDSGAAYVFERNAAGLWEERAYLKADPIRAGAHFGIVVALDGDWLAVSAPEDSGGGAVYVYEREADGWAQRTVLREPSGGRFGAALLLRGDRLFVGNPGDSTGARGAGSTFVYERAAGGWTRKHTLRAARPVAGEWLGSALALAGDTLLNGATGPAPQGSGRVLVFREVDDDWREQQTLTPEPAELGSFFGTSIAVHGDDLVVGAFNGTVGLTGGLAYVYQRDGSGTFVQRAVLRPSNTRAGDFFASGIALAGTTLAIGASQESSAAGGIGTPATGALDRSGALYLFDGAGGAYRQSLQIKSEAPRVLEEFGRNVVVSGDAMFVSASADPDRDGKSGDSGAVYVFR